MLMNNYCMTTPFAGHAESKGLVAMKLSGCTDEFRLLDPIPDEGANVMVDKFSHNLSRKVEAVMARKVEGWD
ncbi:hypothetical protein RYZ27_08215 [Hyphomonas sp. FCG-A18]|uniref:hypothetical protein n=1 Tax=Hyphomonas sp. FCG-A18 TaxID=3080019 RepID=UPI002B2CA2CF|nr:hypothetical protein RYZ27_08215 [Hyphomonas sp. FCG-A18]